MPEPPINTRIRCVRPSLTHFLLFLRYLLVSKSCLSESENTVHFVVHNHEAFVYAHAWLCQNLVWLCCHSAAYTNLSASVGFVACSALVSTYAFVLAVENRFDCIIDSTKIRGLYLNHVSSLIICK